LIEYLTIKNFQSHSESFLEFSPGVNVILGDTDSGKTAILRAVNWLVTNRPRGSTFVRRGKKFCSVSIRTTNGLVEREKKSSFNGYRVEVGDFKSSFTEVGTTVPPEVLPVLRLEDVNTQSQLSSHFLIGMSDGQISKALAELLGFEFADKLAGLVKSGSGQVNKDVSRLSDEALDLQSKLEILEARLSVRADVDLGKELYRELESEAMSASTLEMLIGSYRSAAKCLNEAERLSVALKGVDVVSSKFAELELVKSDYSAYAGSFLRLRSASNSLTSSKKRFTGLVDVSGAEAKLETLTLLKRNIDDLSRSVVSIGKLSIELDTAVNYLKEAESSLVDAFAALEEVVDNLEHCSECLRPFSEEDRDIAKRVAQ